MNKVITIAREYGSGGREIGIKLAEKLGLKFYDKEIIAMAAQDGGLDAAFVEAHEEKAPSIMSGAFGNQSFASFAYHPSYSDTIYFKQCDVLKDVASKGPCVIVGRCSDYVLRDFDTVNIFIYSDMASKIARKKMVAQENAKLSDDELEKDITRVNKGRKKYYEHYSGHRWGDPENFDLCINTSKLGSDGAVELICAYLDNLK